ncbi:hypothetical protein AALA48_07650 [Bifidobacterium pseudolongum]|uniref:hypothetical protein n=1 Tax=Bifidobacterium pseudolongum TaxID=1694 RepID=UPI0035189831
MSATRMERIDSLLDPDSLMTTERRAQQLDLGWDSTESVGRKITRLAYHLGGQWLDTIHDAPDSRDVEDTLTAAVLIHLDATYGTALRTEADPAGRVVVTQDGEGSPEWARSAVAAGGYPSRQVFALMDIGRVDMARVGRFRGVPARHGATMSIVLARGVRHTTRSMFAAKADHPRLDDHACSWPMPTPGMLAFRTRAVGRPDIAGRIDVELLLGHVRLRAALHELTGIDIGERRGELAAWMRMTPEQQARRAQVLDTLGDALDQIAMNEDAHRLQALNIKDRRTGTIAGAFDDKIVVSRQVADLAARSPLNTLFGHVEYDEDIDRGKIHQMEQEIITAMCHLPQSGQGLTALRVRKLGRYRGNTMGVYSPAHTAIALDDGKATRNGYSGMSSFMHEWAHHLDHTSIDGTQLSMAVGFRPMLKAVNDDIDMRRDQYSRDFRDYLKTPTEAFARCFEYWASEIVGVESSLLADHHTYRTSNRYAAMRGHEDLLERTMRAFFPDFQPFDTLDPDQWDHRRDETEETATADDPYAMPEIAPFDYSNAMQPDIFDLLAMEDGARTR